MGRLLRRLALAWFRMRGWELTGSVPRQGKNLFVFGPHTSSWDMVYVMGAIGMSRIYMRIFLGKHCNRFPFSRSLRALGVRFYDRNKSGELGLAIEQLVVKFPKLNIGIEPKGTSGKVQDLSDDFREVAIRHSMHIVLVGIDYERRKIKVYTPFLPSVSAERDMRFIQGSLSVFRGKHPKGNIPKRSGRLVQNL